MKGQRITRFEIKYLIVVITIALVFILISEYQLSHQKKINMVTRVDSIYLNQSNVSYSRMTMTIKHIGSFPSVLELISNPQDFDGWDYEPPLIKFSGYRYIPEIGHVPLPYIFFKSENSDTIVIRKDSFFLYFRFKEFKDL